MDLVYGFFAYLDSIQFGFMVLAASLPLIGATSNLLRAKYSMTHTVVGAWIVVLVSMSGGWLGFVPPAARGLVHFLILPLLVAEVIAVVLVNRLRADYLRMLRHSIRNHEFEAALEWAERLAKELGVPTTGRM